MTIKNPSEKQRAAKKAGERTFSFFIVALLGHAIYHFTQEWELNASFYILMAGLAFFFINDAVLAKRAGSGKTDQ